LRATVFKTAARALFGERLTTLDHGSIGPMVRNPGAYCEHIDALLRAAADGWDVDSVNELRCHAIVEFDDSERTADTRIDPEDFHGMLSSCSRP
jgi:hypothetical protein